MENIGLCVAIKVFSCDFLFAPFAVYYQEHGFNLIGTTILTTVVKGEGQLAICVYTVKACSAYLGLE